MDYKRHGKGSGDMRPFSWGYFNGFKKITFWGWVTDKTDNPFAPRISRANGMQKVVRADNKPKAILTVNPFKAVAK